MSGPANLHPPKIPKAKHRQEEPGRNDKATADIFKICKDCPRKKSGECEHEPLANGTCENKPIGSGSFHLLRAGLIAIKPPQWLIKGILERDAFGVLFGKYGSLKSFLALDFAFSVASGTEWHGRKVSQGPAIYIAGEGYNGLARRRKAWEISHHKSLSDLPIYFSDKATILVDETAMQEVSLSISEVAKIDGPPALIIVDTWSRNLGADENSTLDSAAAVTALDRLRSGYGACVLVVHHEGLQSGRARGSTALMGAADFAYRSERGDDGISRLTNEKMKDGSPPDPLAFGLKNINLDVFDEDGEEVSSAVIEPQEYTPIKCPGQSGRPSKEGNKILTKLDEYANGTTLDDLSRALDPLRFLDVTKRSDQAKFKSATRSALERLIEKGEVFKQGTGPAAIFITAKQNEAGQLSVDKDF